jgi:NAD(P) transhydrogenase subunit beta
VSRLDAVQLCYLLAAVCFILALKGLSAPSSARAGNLVGAAGMVLAVGATFALPGLGRIPLIVAGMVLGAAIGAPAARVVRMTAVPQMVAAFNGVGGAAASLVALLEFAQAGRGEGSGVQAATVFAALVGAVSFSGSAVTFLKLQELMTGAPVVLPAARVTNAALAVVAVAAAVLVIGLDSLAWAIVLALVGLLLGVAFVLPVGGADVPVVISLLNACTGLAVAASGFVLANVLLIVAGTLVGASGTLLTRLMATAMGRPLTATLFGALAGPSTAGSTAAVGGDRAVRSAGAEDLGVLLAYARKVMVVPGYGLAVAQAQHTVHELAELLESRGVAVSYAIHPVAGRMPGHMNVLLAEANVPYEQLKEMDEANPEFARTDVVLVVGANDVVNPAAKTSPGSPIYGMPILDVEDAAHVVFLKRSMRPGFAGIDNELLYSPKTTLLFGDAKASLGDLVTAVKAA